MVSFGMAISRIHFERQGAAPFLRRGFSLVELLVVIVVVAVLVALLSSAIPRSIAYAHQATCAGNLKQIHAAIMAYTNDHNGYFPPYCDTTPGRPYYYWNSKLRPYLRQPVANNFWDNAPAPENLFRCPAETRPRTDYQSTYGTGIENNGHSGLCGLNGLWFGVWAYDDGFRKGWTKAYPLASATQPSRTALLFDHDQGKASGPTQLRESVYAFRHGGKINVIYFDGHVGMISKDAIPPSSDVFWRGE